MQTNKSMAAGERRSRTRWGTLKKLRAAIESGIRNAETYGRIAKAINSAHGTQVTESAIASYAKRHGLDRLHPDYIEITTGELPNS